MKLALLLDYLNQGGKITASYFSESYLYIYKDKYYLASGKTQIEYKLTPYDFNDTDWEKFESLYEQCIICGQYPKLYIDHNYPKADLYCLKCLDIDDKCLGISHSVSIYGPTEKLTTDNWNLVNKSNKKSII